MKAKSKKPAKAMGKKAMKAAKGGATTKLMQTCADGAHVESQPMESFSLNFSKIERT